MKRLFYQIKYSSFCKKIENEIKMLEKIEKKAIKEAQETRKISFQNYLKQKEKGLLTKEYFEQEYKNLEDIIFERIQISNKRRTEILKNLKEENFKNLKINPLIIEELRKYTNSDDNSPFKAKEILIDNKTLTEPSRDSIKISAFLNENFSVDNSNINNSSSKIKNTSDIEKSEEKHGRKELKKLNRRKIIHFDKNIYSILKIDKNQQILEKEFSEVLMDKRNMQSFDPEGRDKAFIDFFEKKFNQDFAEAQTKVEQIKLKNIKKDIDKKIDFQNNKCAEGGKLTNPNKIVKLNYSRKTHPNSQNSEKFSFLDEENSDEKSFKEAILDRNTLQNFNPNIESEINDKSYKSNESDYSEKSQTRDETNEIEKMETKKETNQNPKKIICQKPITEESLIDKYLREFGEDENPGTDNKKMYEDDLGESEKSISVSKSLDNNFSGIDDNNTTFNSKNVYSINKSKNEKISNESIKVNEETLGARTKQKQFAPLENNDFDKKCLFDSFDVYDYEEHYSSSVGERDFYDEVEIETDFISNKIQKSNDPYNYSNKKTLVYDPEINYANLSYPQQKSFEHDKNSSNHSELINSNNQKSNSKTFLKEDLKNKNRENYSKEIKTNEEIEEENAQPNMSLEKITQINLRGVNLKENYLVKPTAKTLPLLKKETIYNHDQLQILASLKTIEFKIKNIPKLIDMLSIIRRKKKFKTYDLPEIANTINFVSNYISAENNTIPASYIVNFLYSLSEMQNFDEAKPSLSNELIVYEILDKLVPKLNSLDNRSLSNLLFALQRYQISSPKIFNFADFLDKIEELVVRKFSTEGFSHICITQAVTAYSKCQAGSEEFYRIFADLIYAKRKDLTPKEISIVLYSYSNNINCNEKLLVSLENDVLENINKFNSIELCNIARAFDKKKILDDIMKRKLIDTFVEKHENVKLLDLSYLYKILADEKEKKFLKYSHSLINSLSHDIDAVSLVNFMSKADMIYKVDKNLLSLLKKITIKFIDKKQIKGFELKKIYEYVKDLPFDGRYNTFVENVVRQLEKIKYY